MSDDAALLSVPPGQGIVEPWLHIPPGQGLPYPSEPPTITALNPDTGPANTDITIAITGTGFDDFATVNIGAAFGLIPASITPTDLSVLVEAINIAQPGLLAVSVKNGDGQLSNTLDFSVT